MSGQARLIKKNEIPPKVKPSAKVKKKPAITLKRDAEPSNPYKAFAALFNK